MFCEYWKHTSADLAYEWDTENFEDTETERIEYTNYKKKMCQKLNCEDYEEPESRRLLKKLVSTIVLLLMVSVTGLNS